MPQEAWCVTVFLWLATSALIAGLPQPPVQLVHRLLLRRWFAVENHRHDRLSSTLLFTEDRATIKVNFGKSGLSRPDFRVKRGNKVMQSLPFDQFYEGGPRARPRWADRPNAAGPSRKLPPFRTLKNKHAPGSTFREIRLPNGALNYEIDRTVSAHNAEEEQEIVNEVLRVLQPARYREPGRIETYLPPDMARAPPPRQANYMIHRYHEPRFHAPFMSFGPDGGQFQIWRPRPPALWSPPVLPNRLQQRFGPGNYNYNNYLSKWPTMVPVPGYNNGLCEQGCCYTQPYSGSNAGGCSWSNCTECCPPPPPPPQPPDPRYRTGRIRFSAHEINGPERTYESRCRCETCAEAAAAAKASSVSSPFQQFNQPRPFQFPPQVFSYSNEFNTWSKQIWRSPLGPPTATPAPWPDSSKGQQNQTRVICGGSYGPFGHAFRQQQQQFGRPISSTNSFHTTGNPWNHSQEAGGRTTGEPRQLSERESTPRFSQDISSLHENRRGLSIHPDTATDNEGNFKGRQVSSDDSTYSSKQPDVCDENLWDSVQRDQQILRVDDESKKVSADPFAKGDEESTEEAQSAGLPFPESPIPETDTPLGSPKETKCDPSELGLSSSTVGSVSEPKYPLLTAAGPGSPLFSSPRSSPGMATSSPELPLPELSPYSGFVDDSLESQ